MILCLTFPKTHRLTSCANLVISQRLVSSIIAKQMYMHANFRKADVRKKIIDANLLQVW